MSTLQFEFSRRSPGVLLLKLTGWLDASNVGELAQEQDKELADPEIRDFIWDVSDLTLVASAGIRALMTAYKSTLARKGKTYVVGANKNVAQVIRIIRLDQFLVMADNMDDVPAGDLS